MQSFDAPANANTPAISPLLWFKLPMAAYATAIDVAGYQLRGWAAMHQAMIEMNRSVWRVGQTEPTDAKDLETSPVFASAAADVRSAGAAMIQAQLDAMEAFRRSA